MTAAAAGGGAAESSFILLCPLSLSLSLSSRRNKKGPFCALLGRRRRRGASSIGPRWPMRNTHDASLSLSLCLPYYLYNPEYLKNANESMKSMGRGAL